MEKETEIRCRKKMEEQEKGKEKTGEEVWKGDSRWSRCVEKGRG